MKKSVQNKYLNYNKNVYFGFSVKDGAASFIISSSDSYIITASPYEWYNLPFVNKCKFITALHPLLIDCFFYISHW